MSKAYKKLSFQLGSSSNILFTKSSNKTYPEECTVTLRLTNSNATQ